MKYIIFLFSRFIQNNNIWHLVDFYCCYVLLSVLHMLPCLIYTMILSVVSYQVGTNLSSFYSLVNEV